jgi:mediator of RNA polymerase II transcription subunit 17, fungi type
MLLDFVSLLESKYSEKHGEGSISEALRKAVPVGSLAFDVWEMPPQSDEETKNEENVARGWRMEGLTKAADALLKAATRLEQDVRKETKFWSQILDVNSQGRVIFRHPKQRPDLGTQVASIEAGPVFKERGLMVLKPDEDGVVSLRQSIASSPKTIRVRISREGRIVGCSKRVFSASQEANVITPLETQVARARDSLFEEEFFHEMTIETRGLFSFGVRFQFKDHSIHIPTTSPADSGITGDMVIVDLVDINAASDANYGHDCDELADALVCSLRLLLLQLHRQRLRRRTAIPPPLSENKRIEPPSTIIRPVMRMLQFETMLWSMRFIMKSISSILKSAGIAIDLAESENIREVASNDSNQALRDSQPADQLNKPASKIVSFTLPSSSSTFRRPNDQAFKVSIELTTQFLQPPFGTTYTITTPSIITQVLRPPHLSHTHKWVVYDIDSVVKKICEIIELDIAHNMLAVNSKIWTASPMSADLTAMIKLRDLDSQTLVRGLIMVRLEETKKHDEVTPRKIPTGLLALTVGRRVSTQTHTGQWVKWDENISGPTLMEVVGQWMTGV